MRSFRSAPSNRGSTHSWTERSFQGPIAREKAHLVYRFGQAMLARVATPSAALAGT